MLGRDKGDGGIEGLVLFAANTGAALAKVKHVCTALNCSRNDNWRQTVHFMTRMYLVGLVFFLILARAKHTEKSLHRGFQVAV